MEGKKKEIKYNMVLNVYPHCVQNKAHFLHTLSNYFFECNALNIISKYFFEHTLNINTKKYHVFAQIEIFQLELIYQETEVTSTPTRPVDNVVTTTKDLQDRNIHILDDGGK